MRQQAALGVKWTALSQASRISTQLLGIIILGRLLPPSDYGLAAMAAVFSGFASLFRDLGTTAAIIQKRDPSASLLDSVFWLNVAFGCGLAVLLCLFSPLIALGFAEPRLKNVLCALLVSFPIVGLGAVHQALLEKASRFRPLAILESTADCVGLVGSVWAAWAGWGVYSLVLQTLLIASFSSAGLWFISQWRPAFRWEASEIYGVMGFSSNLVGFNMFNYFIRNADDLLIGRFLGATDLGYYSMAYRLMLWPLQNISSVVGRALFPVFSCLQAEHYRLSAAYVSATAAITLVTAPLMFGLFVLREPFVVVALGQRWQPVAQILAWLVPVGLLDSIGTTVGSLYLATGRTDIMFKWGIAAGLVMIPAFAFGLQWGITGVAASYCIASLVLFCPSLALPFRLLNLHVGAVLLRLLPSIASAGAMALVVFVVAVAWPSTTDSPLLRLTTLIALGVLTYGCIILLTQRELFKDIFRMMLHK